MGGLFGGGSEVRMPDNSAAMMAMMREQDERNREQFAIHQENIMAAQERQAELERASRLASQQEEAELLATAQAMEDAAQEETAQQAYEEEVDYDNIITGFYESLGEGGRPE